MNEPDARSAPTVRIERSETTAVRVLLVAARRRIIGRVNRACRGAECLGKPLKIRQTGSLDSALKLLGDSWADVVLLELAIGGSEGLDSFMQIRSMAPSVPVIVIGEVKEIRVMTNAVREGADGSFFTREINRLSLARILSNVVVRKLRSKSFVSESELLENLLDKMPDRIYFKDLKSRFIRVSKAMAELFGLEDPREMIGKSDFDFFTREHAQPAYEDEQELIRSQQPVLSKVEKETFPDGGVGWALTTKMPLLDQKGNVRGTFGISKDVTRLHEMEESLRLHADQLAQRNEELRNTQMQLIQLEKLQSIGTLAAGVAHEVRNPLARINLGIDYLEGGIGSEDPQLPNVLNTIRTAVDRADAIVQGLVEYSSDRQLEIHFRQVNEVVDAALLLVEHEFSAHDVIVRKELGEDLPSAPIDAAKMEQVLINLLMNSIQAMEACENPRLEVRTYDQILRDIERDEGARTATLLRNGDHVVVVEINDSGSGIPPEKISKLFDPFFTTKATGVGTGLGLSVASRIVQLHDGQITLTNRPDGGVQTRLVLRAKRQRVKTIE